MKEFKSKRPGEAVTLTFDFVDAIPDGLTAASADPVTIDVVGGEDAGPAAMLSGAAVLYGTMVLQRVEGGIMGNDYLAVARILLSDGQSRELPALLPIRVWT